MARSKLVTKAFLWEKVKTVEFSETIAASDLKVSRSSHLIEYVKHDVQHRMISVDNFFVFLRLLCFALLLLYVT